MPVRRRRSVSPDGSGAGEPCARAAYSRGDTCERAGDLDGATRWFRRAAETGCPKAALRLGDLLGRLADERGGAASHSPELLLAEATRWLCEVRTSSSPDAIELITDMLNRHQRLAARRGLEPVVAG